MLNRIPFKLTPLKNALLTIAGSSALAIPVAICVSIVPQTAMIRAQSPAAEVPKWEATSVKRCNNNEAGGEQGPPPLTASSERIRLSCFELAYLIQDAYVVYAGGRFNGNNYPVIIEQVPGWSNSERYTVEAKAEGSPGQAMMMGPMLQALLADRFALKIHSETRGEPAYILTLAKGGFKLQPFQGGCTPVNPVFPDTAPPKNRCPTPPVMNLDTFAWLLERPQLRLLDAPVINNTGITGYFQFSWEPFRSLNPLPFAVPRDQVIASVFSLVQDLGLKLERTKAPRPHLVVDHVERPSEN